MGTHERLARVDRRETTSNRKFGLTIGGAMVLIGVAKLALVAPGGVWPWLVSGGALVVHRYDGSTVAAAVERAVDAARRIAAPRSQPRDPASDLLGRDRAHGPRPAAAAAGSPSAALRRRRHDLLD